MYFLSPIIIQCFHALLGLPNNILLSNFFYIHFEWIFCLTHLRNLLRPQTRWFVKTVEFLVMWHAELHLHIIFRSTEKFGFKHLSSKFPPQRGHISDSYQTSTKMTSWTEYEQAFLQFILLVFSPWTWFLIVLVFTNFWKYSILVVIIFCHSGFHVMCIHFVVSVFAN